LLSQRAEEANLLYLTESKRRRKNATKQASTQLPPKTTTTSSSSNDKPTAKRTPKNNNNNNKRKKAMSSSDDESASSENDSRKVEEIDEDDEDEDDEEETISSSDNGSVHDISDYLYLINMLHYDKDEKCVYISTRVVEEGDYIVVYRKRQLKNGQWAKSESYQPIFAKDVVEMTKLYSMNNKKS